MIFLHPLILFSESSPVYANSHLSNNPSLPTPQSVSTDLARVKTYLLPPSHVTPLPTLAEFPFSRRHEFPQGSYVLALYPEEGCTVFYRARVMKTAKKRKGPYQLRFDEEDEDRLVPAKFVIPYREGVAATRDDKWSGMSDDVGES